MAKLWPENIFSSANIPVLAILNEAAVDLARVSENLLSAEVRQRLQDGEFIFEFVAFARSSPEHSYELFRVASRSGDFPATVNSHNGPLRRASSQAEFENTLSRVFHAPETRGALKLIALSAAKEDNPTLQGPPIFIAREVFYSAQALPMAHASFFGIGCFLELEMLSKLANLPGDENSAYQFIAKDRLVTTVSVVGGLKMTLTKKQVDQLAEAARICLSSVSNSRNN